MKQVVLFLSILFLSTSLIAQEEKSVQESPPIWKSCESSENPTECTEAALASFISEQVVYPDEAYRYGINGKVFIKFVISTEGRVEEVQVLRGADELLDNEAVRVVSGMPDFIPAIQNDKVVPFQYTIPVNFYLTEKEIKKGKKRREKEGKEG